MRRCPLPTAAGLLPSPHLSAAALSPPPLPAAHHTAAALPSPDAAAPSTPLRRRPPQLHSSAAERRIACSSTLKAYGRRFYLQKSISMASGGEASRGSVDAKSEKQKQKKKKRAGEEDLLIEGHSIGGLSIAGHETCVIVPSLNLAFDIGKCPQRAISQQFLFISHGHMDHIGYIVYSVRHKLKQEYVGRPGTELKILKLSGIEITDTHTAPEIAFTGDTTSDFITDADNADVLRAKILIMESTYVENLCTVEDARDYGHTHLSEIISHADRFQNKAILLIHFSARYQLDVIENAISALPPPLAGRVFALTNGFG